MSDNFSLTQGSTKSIRVQLVDSDGVDAGEYLGTESLTTSVWPGGTRTETISPVTTWVDGPSGIILITISSTQSLLLESGRHQLLTRLAISPGELVDAYEATIDVSGVAGTELEPRVYTDYNSLLMYGRSWLRQLQTDDDEVGFAEQRARARTWLEDLAHTRWSGSVWSRDPWLTTQLDADYLVINDKIKECLSKKALAIICDGQIGTGQASAAYAKLASLYHSQADYLATTLVLEIAPPPGNFPIATIDLSTTVPNRG